jgi:hypothetical protein
MHCGYTADCSVVMRKVSRCGGIETVKRGEVWACVLNFCSTILKF